MAQENSFSDNKHEEPDVQTQTHNTQITMLEPTWTWTNPDSDYCTQFPTVLPVFGKQEAVVLGNQKSQPKSQAPRLALDQCHIKYTKHAAVNIY